MRLLGQFQTSFFFTKRFRAYSDADQSKTNQKNKIKWTKNNKGNNFSGMKTSKSGLICSFVRVKSFRKKKKKKSWFEIALIASSTIIPSQKLPSYFYCLYLVIFAGFRKVTNSFQRNSVTYGTPCHAIGSFDFWYHEYYGF